MDRELAGAKAVCQEANATFRGGLKDGPRWRHTPARTLLSLG